MYQTVFLTLEGPPASDASRSNNECDFRSCANPRTSKRQNGIGLALSGFKPKTLSFSITLVEMENNTIIQTLLPYSFG